MRLLREKFFRQAVIYKMRRNFISSIFIQDLPGYGKYHCCTGSGVQGILIPRLVYRVKYFVNIIRKKSHWKQVPQIKGPEYIHRVTDFFQYGPDLFFYQQVIYFSCMIFQHIRKVQFLVDDKEICMTGKRADPYSRFILLQVPV